MTPRTRCSAVIALITSMALPAWGQQYLLYSPQSVTSAQMPAAQDGVLVQEIVIQKGDTLSRLSRRFSGRGSYFPQILLFNSIKNPDLIYTGKTLRVPISQKEGHDSDLSDAKPPAAAQKPRASVEKKSPLKAATKPSVRQTTATSPVSTPSTELSLSDLKTVGTDKSRASRTRKKSAPTAKKSPVHAPQTMPLPPSSLPPEHTSSAAPSPVSDAKTGQKLFEAAIKAYRQDDCRTALELLDRYLADNSGSPLAADANLYKAECYLKLSAQ